MTRKKQRGLPTVMRAQEIMDKAYKKASKISITDKKAFYAQRKTAVAKLSSISDTIPELLKKYVSGFPSFENLHPFYREIYDLLVGVDRARKALSALSWCAENVKKVCKKNISQIRKTKSIQFIKMKMNETYGRVSSFLNQIDKDLEFLIGARKSIIKIPDIDPSIPTAVIAGFPNVGKSMMVTKLSSGKPQVAEYPFTTKRVSLGHFSYKRRKFQILDTPGLLDRPLEKRNDIEKQAVLALRHLADCIVFLIDPTGESGGDIETQDKLMNTIKDMFPVPFVPVMNKCDKLKNESEFLSVSALTGDGLEELKKTIGSILEESAKKKEIPPWENPEFKV
jgi:nucleolar GTP-binding protein